jgi:signal transduction histidine kinase
VVTQLSELESARLKLARGARATDPELARSLHQVLRVAASTLNLERVGVWTIELDWTELRNLLTFDQRSGEFSSGLVLRLADFPGYARALHERRVIAAEDALNDPRTRELRHSYLAPHGIASLLDCPVYEDGEVVAIVCHERVGVPAPWQKRDQDFAVSVADIVGTLFAQIASIRYELELRAAREELSQARVMDALGRMAAGVAHDFNNVLSGVSLALHVLDAALPPEADERETTRDALELVERGGRLVKQLLTFARQGAYGGTPVEAHAWLGKTLPQIARSLGSDIRVTAELATEPAPVALDSSVFEQVVVNLLNNARDAMLGGGEITIRSRCERGRLVLSVKDSGVGMDEETRRRVFEPFFTTKQRTGTGLGLAIVFGAVRSAGGSISVDSEPGRGAAFTLEFPLVATRGG